MSHVFPNAVVTFFEPNPGAIGMCSITPANGNYIAALQQSDFSPALCGQCALISCAGAQCGGRSVAVQITDSLGGNPSSISISLGGMADLVGGESNARNLGVLSGAQWQLIECPSVLGIQSAVSQTRSSVTTSSLSSSSGPVSSLESTTSFAPLFPSPISDAPTAVITASTNPKASLSAVNSNSVNTAGSSPVPMGAIIGGAVGGIAFLIIGGLILFFCRKRPSEKEKDVSPTPSSAQPGAPSRSFTASPPPLSSSASPSPFIASPPPRSFTDSPTSTGRSTPSTMPDHVVVVERPREKKDSFLNAISVNGNNRNSERGYNLKFASDKAAAAQGMSRYENVDPVNWTVSEVEDWAVKRCGATEAVVNLISDQHLTGAALLLLKFESIPQSLKPALYGDQVLLQYLIKRIKDLHDTRLAELSQGMNNAPPSYDA
ncbi:hypothetical protein BJ741DRAFT_610300 [Chytriomyces cf. hyalinus JEL632]|nr:hypothetical protein BJ741DRAFT_610300 [Chytriomyces cf. hyalinus JEL632]